MREECRNVWKYLLTEFCHVKVLPSRVFSHLRLEDGDVVGTLNSMHKLDFIVLKTSQECGGEKMVAKLSGKTFTIIRIISG